MCYMRQRRNRYIFAADLDQGADPRFSQAYVYSYSRLEVENNYMTYLNLEKSKTNIVLVC